MASFTSILTGVAHGFKKFFGGAVKVAQAAEPFVDIAFPGIAMLYNTTVNEVAKAEAAAIVAGTQSGTGAQKLAMVLAAIEPAFTEYATQTGIPSTQRAQVIENWVNAVVASLNAIPAPTPTP